MREQPIPQHRHSIYGYGATAFKRYLAGLFLFLFNLPQDPLLPPLTTDAQSRQRAIGHGNAPEGRGCRSIGCTLRVSVSFARE
jgi:hypothetical protein